MASWSDHVEPLAVALLARQEHVEAADQLLASGDLHVAAPWPSLSLTACQRANVSSNEVIQASRKECSLQGLKCSQECAVGYLCCHFFRILHYLISVLLVQWYWP